MNVERRLVLQCTQPRRTVLQLQSVFQGNHFGFTAMPCDTCVSTKLMSSRHLATAHDRKPTWFPLQLLTVDFRLPFFGSIHHDRSRRFGLSLWLHAGVSAKMLVLTSLLWRSTSDVYLKLM